EGGSPASLLNVPAAVIVFGGTVAAGMISFPMGTGIGALPKYLLKAILDTPLQPKRVVESFVALADKARREGLLSLEQDADSIDPFGRKGILLVVDGNEPEMVREVLEAEADAMRERHQAGYGLLEALGGYAPTMGIIGTVMGLINVLSHLEDTSQ